MDFFEAEVDIDEVRFYSPKEYRPRGNVAGDPTSVKEAVELLQRAERPAVVAGDGAYTASPEALQRFIEVVRAPCSQRSRPEGWSPTPTPTASAKPTCHSTAPIQAA